MSASEQEKLVGVDADEKDDEEAQVEKATPSGNKSEILTVKASIFGNKEGKFAFAWLLFTFLYWSIIVWIPTIQTMAFGGAFIIWCIGCIALISCSYTLYEGKYPSGSTATDPFETGSIGRYTAAFLTTSIIVDVIVLIWKTVANDYAWSTAAVRLSLHCVHIFWSSLFFYNKFYRHHYHMATRAFFIEWADIIWTIFVSATLNHIALNNNTDMNGVHYVYFIYVTASLCGWMLPMMLIREWGAHQYARIVSMHLLVLDLCTDIPVVVVVLSYKAYESNNMLFADVFWKSFIIVRSISYYIVNQMLYKTQAKNAETEKALKMDAGNVVVKSDFRKLSSLAWIIYVAVYWTAGTFGTLINDYEIANRYEYYTWVGGMIGVMCVYDTWMAGYHATTKRGRSMVAFACTFICTDWVLRSFEVLYWNEARWDIMLMMTLHAIAVMWALIFFYQHALKAGRTGSWFNTAFVSLVFEWIDIMFMYVVIVILNGELGTCFSTPICVGYFVLASTKLFVWFFPIMFRAADTEWRMHVHMVVLDTCTDLPLIIILFATEAYTIHWFLFFDVCYKLIMLLRTYAYHLVINLILKRVELNESHKQQLQQALAEDDGDIEIIHQDGV